MFLDVIFFKSAWFLWKLASATTQKYIIQPLFQVTLLF